MKRDMELIRSILFKLETVHTDSAIYNLIIDGKSFEEVAYHCKIMYEANLIDNYDSQFADNKIYSFAIGGLTWYGHDFLEQIKNDEVWIKTVEVVEEKKLPNTIEFLAKIAGRFTGAMISEMN